VGSKLSKILSWFSAEAKTIFCIVEFFIILTLGQQQKSLLKDSAGNAG
jgi:hypothetical protein